MKLGMAVSIAIGIILLVVAFFWYQQRAESWQMKVDESNRQRDSTAAVSDSIKTAHAIEDSLSQIVLAEKDSIIADAELKGREAAAETSRAIEEIGQQGFTPPQLRVVEQIVSSFQLQLRLKDDIIAAKEDKIAEHMATILRRDTFIIQLNSEVVDLNLRVDRWQQEAKPGFFDSTLGQVITAAGAFTAGILIGGD